MRRIRTYRAYESVFNYRCVKENWRKIIMSEKQIYTDKEASLYLRVSQITLWRERKKGKISFRRVASKIVYLQEDLENYLNQNKREAFGVK